MSEEPTAGERAQHPELRPDRVVERVVGSGASSRPVAVLTGLLGQGSADGVWRLYLSQSFDEYVEFDAADVVHSESVNEAVPLDGTRVWVEASAKLQYTQVSSRQVQADFLRGGITSAHLSRAGAASFESSARSATGYACTRNYICSTNPHIPVCQERTEYGCGSLDCPPTGALCPSGAFIC
jgi:hypothetical protein